MLPGQVAWRVVGCCEESPSGVELLCDGLCMGGVTRKAVNEEHLTHKQRVNISSILTLKAHTVASDSLGPLTMK